MHKTMTLLLVTGFVISSSFGGLKTDLLRRDARNGDVKAQYDLGMAYQMGDGIKRDYDQAYIWYQKAAEQDYREAQLALGKCYANGWGVDRDAKRAFEWALKSAKQGYAPAQWFVGLSYETGVSGVDPNLNEAVRWVRLSATQGFANGQFALGRYYHDGIGVKPDERKAVEWYLDSAENGNLIGKYTIARNYHQWSSYLANKVSVLDILKEVAEKGDVESQFNLARFYLNRGEEGDLEASIKWLQLSGRQGCIPANRLLAEYYLTGQGVEKDVGAATDLYLGLAESGDCECMEKLGDIYAGEGGGLVDYPASTKWYLKAAKYGRLTAQIKCIFMYGKGQGVKADRVETYAWALVISGNGKPAYKQNLEPILSLDEKVKAQRRYRALLLEMRRIKKSADKRL